MPHLIQFDHDRPSRWLWLGSKGGCELFDPVLYRWNRYTNQLRCPRHRQTADIKQNRRYLLHQRTATRRRICEVILAVLAAISLLAPHLPVLDKTGTLTTLADHDSMDSCLIVPY